MWRKYFVDEDIFFVTPDVKRGLGFAGILPRYHIVCIDFDPIIPILKKQGANIFCLEEKEIEIGKIRNSGKLLENTQVLDYIKNNAKVRPRIMYFKPALKLDILIGKNGFAAIGNTARLNELFEDKISFYQIAQKELSQHLIPAKVGVLGELNYSELTKKLGSIFVIQFGHGWAGKTTFFIKDEKEFTGLKEKFPYTKVKAGKFIEGFTVLNNCCIYKDQVLISQPAIQIDSVAELSDKPGVTCGRQWPVRFIDNKQIETIGKISGEVGNLMYGNGFKGFFGIDFLVEQATGQIYLSEINARMTASSAFFTLIEIGLGTIPLLSYHLAQFAGKTLPQRKETKSLVASQVILRQKMSLSKFGDSLFGVFKTNGEVQLSRFSYDPQSLKENECIFMGKSAGTDEFGRIETKNEVLERPGELNKWLKNLLATESVTEH